MVPAYNFDQLFRLKNSDRLFAKRELLGSLSHIVSLSAKRCTDVVDLINLPPNLMLILSPSLPKLQTPRETPSRPFSLYGPEPERFTPFYVA